MNDQTQIKLAELQARVAVEQARMQVMLAITPPYASDINECVANINAIADQIGALADDESVTKPVKIQAIHLYDRQGRTVHLIRGIQGRTYKLQASLKNIHAVYFEGCFCDEGLPDGVVADEELRPLPESHPNHPAQPQRPLPKGAVIEFLGNRAKVLHDNGGNNITVEINGESREWVWKSGAETCTIVSLPAADDGWIVVGDRMPPLGEAVETYWGAFVTGTHLWDGREWEDSKTKIGTQRSAPVLWRPLKENENE